MRITYFRNFFYGFPFFRKKTSRNFQLLIPEVQFAFTHLTFGIRIKTFGPVSKKVLLFIEKKKHTSL